MEVTCNHGWRGYMWSAVVRPVGRTAKFSKMTLELDYGREINIKFSSNSSGGHFCSHHFNCTFPQPETSEALFCDKTAYFKVAFYCPQHMCMLFNQLLNIPDLSGGWIILAKEKCSLTGM